jgi:alanyl-tRNA synthetase
MRLSAARAGAADAVAAAQVVGKVRLVAQRMSDGMTAADLRSLVGDIRARLGSAPAVVVLISEVAEVRDDHKGDHKGDQQGVAVPFVVAANDAAVDAGLRAGDLVRGIADAVGGRGGGKADLAQGSGSDPGGIDAALSWVRAELARD